MTKFSGGKLSTRPRHSQNDEPFSGGDEKHTHNRFKPWTDRSGTSRSRSCRTDQIDHDPDPLVPHLPL